MKKIFTKLQLGLLGTVVVLAASCKHEKLADAIKTQSFAPVSASVATSVTVGKGSSYTLDGAALTVPVNITFSSATTVASTIDLTSDVDTVASLISSGALPAGSAAFPSGGAAVAQQVNVPVGVTSVSFNVIVSRSSMELGYGKNLATVIKLSNPTRGNKLVSGKSNLIFIVNTNDILEAGSIHEVYFDNPTNVLNVSDNSAFFEKTSISINFKVPVALQGDPGSELTVDAASTPDSVTKYIANGTLKNCELYANSNITVVNPQVKILAGANKAILTFSTKINTLLAFQPAPAVPSNKKEVVAFTLSNPSKYQLSKTKPRTIFVTIDPNYFRPYLGSPFLVQGAIGAVSGPFYAVNYDFGGEGVAYHDDNNKDGDSNFRIPDNVDANPDYSPRTVVGWTNGGEWLSYSINVQQSGTYQADTYLGSPGDGNQYSIYIDGVLISEKLPVKNTTDYRNQQANTSTINLTAGYHILKMYWDKAQYDYRGIVFTRKS